MSKKEKEIPQPSKEYIVHTDVKKLADMTPSKEDRIKSMKTQTEEDIKGNEALLKKLGRLPEKPKGKKAKKEEEKTDDAPETPAE